MRIKRVFNVLPSKNQDKDWSHELVRPDGAPPTIPPSVDLRATWWPCGNQGSTGSCVGWAVAEGVCRYHFTKAGKLTPGVGLSWRQVWMSSKEEDVLWRPAAHIDSWGTYIKDALDIPRKYGVVDLLTWTSSAKTFTGSYDRFYAEAAKRKIASYFSVGGWNPSGWREWLSTQGPLVVRLDVDTQFRNVTYGQTTPLDNFIPYSGAGHAVCLVGYRDDGTFIVRNSWGSTWGDKGHVYVTERYAAAAFDEAYGVTL